MPRVFYIVGPTAVGKSGIAARVAQQRGAEVVSADAFQVYAGLDLLTAKPDPASLAQAPHHLLGVVPLTEEFSADKFRVLAAAAMAGIRARGHPVIVVGGSGLYLKALTHGLDPVPPGREELRLELDALSSVELVARLAALDPQTAATIDQGNKRRVVRALEICLLSGRPASEVRQAHAREQLPAGVFLWRDRDDLNKRIDARVEAIFAQGVADEVRHAGKLSSTAANTLGLREIQSWLAGGISERECIVTIQQRTRQYAKRQRTWFRHQLGDAPVTCVDPDDPNCQAVVQRWWKESS